MGRPTATILHLSDLHLGQNVLDFGGTHKSSVSSLRRLGGLTMQAHHPYIFPTLRTNIRSAARFVGADGDSFDLAFVTGDISTDANTEERFSFAREYLTGRVTPEGEFGLALGDKPLLCVPGNHDKRGEAGGPQRYLKAFGELPAPAPWRTQWLSPTNRTFIVYGIDSNLYVEGNEAVGRITPETFAWLSQHLENDVALVDSIRIVLLHHHPADLNRFRRPGLRTFLHRLRLPSLTRLEDGWRLLRLCKGRVQIVCHGHEHFPVVFLDEDSRCIVVSAGTTAQYVDDRAIPSNSFHALRFDEARVTIVQFDWDGARFRPVVRWRRDLSREDSELEVERLIPEV